MIHWLLQIILAIWNWFLTATGSNNTSGVQYGFWSGFGSDLTEFAILGAIFSTYRHHNCSVKGCPRLSHHEVEGTTFKTCHKHFTPEIHKALTDRHEIERPVQHAFMRRRKSKNG